MRSQLVLPLLQAALGLNTTAPDTLAAAGDRSQQLTRVLRDALHRVLNRLQFGQVLLATVGSTAPFVGLLGTVWGIYNALTGIGLDGKFHIEQVSGPVGEALVMTAAGLVVAIPAVLAYNVLGRQIARIEADLEGFARDLRELLVHTGHELRPAGKAHRPQAHERDQRHAAGGRDAGAAGDLHHRRALHGRPAGAGAAQGRVAEGGHARTARALRVAVGRWPGAACSGTTRPWTTTSLRQRLVEAAQRDPATEVQLRADASVPYGRVVSLIGMAQSAGLSRIGFVADAARRPRSNRRSPRASAWPKA